MAMLKDLQDIAGQISNLATELRSKLYPNGKPDWMSQKDWDNITQLSEED